MLCHVSMAVPLHHNTFLVTADSNQHPRYPLATDFYYLPDLPADRLMAVPFTMAYCLISGHQRGIRDFDAFLILRYAWRRSRLAFFDAPLISTSQSVVP